MATELSRKDFRRVYHRVNGNDPISFDRMLSVIACSGKPLIIDQLMAMWPKDTEMISIDQAYSLFVRYDAPPLPVELSSEEKEYFQGCKVSDLIDCIGAHYPELKEAAAAELQKFKLSNGDIDVNELFQQIEATRKETVVALTAPTASANSSPHMIIKQEYEPQDKGSSIRGVLVISPHLITTQYIVKVPETCKCDVILKLTQNSNMVLEKGVHPFLNDLFLIAFDKDNNFVGVTKHLTEEGLSTGEISISNGTKFLVVSLATTTPKAVNAEKKKEPLLKEDGKLSRQFKVTLMNIFDMFDLDGDALLNRDEYNDYSVASGDNPVTDEEWKNMKEMVSFRDDRMTMTGFLELHQMELGKGDASADKDSWTSLLQIGFDYQLKLINATPFVLELKCDTQPLLLPSLIRMKKEERDRILSHFYRQGEADVSCELEPHLFRTDYFGMSIVDRIRALDNAAYRIEIDAEENVRWNFVSGKEHIRPFNFETELVLICSWVAKAPNFNVKYRIVREEGK